MFHQRHEPDAAHRLVLAELWQVPEAAASKKDQQTSALPLFRCAASDSSVCAQEDVQVDAELALAGQRESSGEAGHKATQLPPVLHEEAVHAPATRMGEPCSSTFQPHNARGEPQEKGKQQAEISAPQHIAGEMPATPETPSSSIEVLGVVMESRSLPRWTFANCTPIGASCHSSVGDGHAVCSDGSGVLVLVALDNGDLCLMHFSPRQDSGERKAEAEGEGVGQTPGCACKEVLAITGGLPLMKRPRGETGFVQVGGDAVLLAGEPQDLEARSPARLAVYSLGSFKRQHVGGDSSGAVASSGERPHSIAFDELTSWPLSRNEPSPKPRCFYSVAVDEKRHIILLFGGAGPAQGHSDSETWAQGGYNGFLPPAWRPLDDLWSFSMFSCQWVQHFRSPLLASSNAAGEDSTSQTKDILSPWPRAVAGHSAAAWERKMWVFGGYTKDCEDAGAKAGGTAIDDLWCISLDGGMWEQVRPNGKAPSPRYRHASCIVNGSLLVYGGFRPDGPVSTVETLYAADITDPKSATWTRVTVLDSLPPPDFYLGAALSHGDKTSTDMWTFLIYGGREAYVISANRLKETAKSYPTRDRMWQRQIPLVHAASVRSTCEMAPTMAIESLQEQRQPFPHDLQESEISGESSFCLPRTTPAKVAWADTGRFTGEQEPQPPNTDDVEGKSCEQPDEQREAGMGERQGHCGLQILATPMPRTNIQPWPGTGTVITASIGGILPQGREPITECPGSEKAPRWRTAFPVQQAAAPIIFRARRRARRRTSKAPREGSEDSHAPPTGDQSSSSPRAKPEFLLQPNSGALLAHPVVQQHGTALAQPQQSKQTIYPSNFQTLQGWEEKPPTKNKPAPVGKPPPNTGSSCATNSTVAPTGAASRDPARPLSRHQLSILLALSHQATIGAVRKLKGYGTGSGPWGERSASADGQHSPARLHDLIAPGTAPRMAVPPLTRPAFASIRSHTGCTHMKALLSGSDICSCLRHQAQPPNAESSAKTFDSTSQQARDGTKLRVREPCGSSAEGPRETEDQQLFSIGSLISGQASTPPASCPPVKQAIPLSPQRSVDGLDALMWWITSSSSARGGTSTTNATAGGSTTNDRSQSCFSSRGSNSNSGSGGGSGRADINSARATAANSRCSSGSDTAAVLDRHLSPVPRQSPAARWADSQDTARVLAGMLYSSQLPATQYNGRKPLPPLRNPLDSSGIGSTLAKSMVARRVAPFAFAAESMGGAADGGLPLPRPARRIKASTSKIRQRSASNKPKGKTGGTAKTKSVEIHSNKATPRQIQHRQPQRQQGIPIPVPRTGRTRSSAQENAAAPHDRVLDTGSRRRVNRADSDAIALGSALRKNSTKSQNGRKTRTPSLPSTVLGAYQSSHERLLRRMVGWPGEAIATLLMAKATSDTDSLHKSRSSSLKQRNLHKK